MPAEILGMLEVRQVQLRPRFGRPFGLLDIARHASNREPGFRRIGMAHLEALADRVLIRPIAAGHRVADDSHQRRSLYVVAIEAASAQQARTPGSEIPR